MKQNRGSCSRVQICAVSLHVHFLYIFFFSHYLKKASEVEEEEETEVLIKMKDCNNSPLLLL